MNRSSQTARAAYAAGCHKQTRRSWMFAMYLLASVTYSAEVLGDDVPGDDQSSPQVCISEFQKTQESRRNGSLLDARAHAVACGQGQCPDVVGNKCRGWVGEIDAAIPTIVVYAIDRDGNDTSMVRLSIAGKLLSERLDGRPIRMDPGTVNLTFEMEGQPPVTQRIVLKEGEKSRSVEVSFAPKDTGSRAGGLASEQDDSGSRTLMFVGFGVGGAGIVAGVVTGIVALGKASDFDEACPDGSSCPVGAQESYDSGQTIAHVSTVAFVVAAAGIGIGLWGLLGGRSSEQSVAGVRPLIGLGFGGVEGSF